MKIFIDSADIDDIKQVYEWGICDGVTTNPSLVHKAIAKQKKKVNMKSYFKELCKVAKGTPVSLEVTTRTAKEMIAEGKKLYKIFNPVAKNVVIKIPVNTAFNKDEPQFEGIKAIRALAKAKIPINCTLIFTPEQALLAAKAGATYVSPFSGRVDDYIRWQHRVNAERGEYFPKGGIKENGKIWEDQGIVSGIDLISECVQIIEMHGLKTQVLAASLRNNREIREAALAGSHVATIPFGVIKTMLMHEKTFEGMKGFTNDVVKEYQNLK